MRKAERKGRDGEKEGQEDSKREGTGKKKWAESATTESLVDVEHNVQELYEEVHLIWESLLIEHHHPSQQQRLLPQAGSKVHGVIRLGEGKFVGLLFSQQLHII